MASQKQGVYIDNLKSGKPNFRASITRNSKHISLGSYPSESEAGEAYLFAEKLLSSDIGVSDYPEDCPLSFEKFVILCNLRDKNIYIKTPIYLENKFFFYYYSPNEIYKFDTDDLFYFSSHKIIKRGSHIFVSDYGSQVSVKERFGIKPFSVEGRDYIFINGDNYDFRRENIEIINRYFGVEKQTLKAKEIYKATINVNGKFIIGRYDDEITAAIAFNKAVDHLSSKGIQKKYPQNYIEGISAREYADIYSNIKISDRLLAI
ncbi:MAG: hypothetical protein J6S95_03790 [Lachnospiraceae bacterium]|nr:hypothetical protein [Lachnospiraceae bacterium]